VNDEPCGLSLTSNNNLLITFPVINYLREYTTQGKQLREIKLDNSIDSPWHAIQLSTGEFVVCHGLSQQHRVVIVNTNGHIIRSYGGAKGSSDGQLNGPSHLTVDSHNNILVADRDNDKIRLLSSSLVHLGDLSLIRREFNRPYRLHLDELNSRLYIGEFLGQRVIAVSYK